MRDTLIRWLGGVPREQYDDAVQQLDQLRTERAETQTFAEGWRAIERDRAAAYLRTLDERGALGDCYYSTARIRGGDRAAGTTYRLFVTPRGGQGQGFDRPLERDDTNVVEYLDAGIHVDHIGVRIQRVEPGQLHALGREEHTYPLSPEEREQFRRYATLSYDASALLVPIGPLDALEHGGAPVPVRLSEGTRAELASSRFIAVCLHLSSAVALPAHLYDVRVSLWGRRVSLREVASA
jgi:hypothetical protein